MKNMVIAITGILSVLVILPINFTITYLLYKHVEAPQAVWILWIIQIPLLIVTQILSAMAKKIKE